MSSDDRTLLKKKVELSRDDLAATLEAVAEQIRLGELDTSEWVDSDSPVDRSVPEQVHLSIEVKDSPKPEGMKRELELEVWWITGV